MSKTKNSLADSDKIPHGNAKEIDWEVFDALLISDPTKVYCCEYLGMSDVHIDNQIRKKFGLTFTEYKSLRLEDTVVRIKAAMINKASQGDVSAGKYVLANIGNWSDKTEIRNTNTNMSLEEFLKQQSEKLKEDK
jgi:hypothetical protein